MLTILYLVDCQNGNVDLITNRKKCTTYREYFWLLRVQQHMKGDLGWKMMN